MKAETMTKETEAPIPLAAKRRCIRIFTNEQVFEIRRRFRAGETNKSHLAREYDVSIGTIRNALHGMKTYKDI